ncbi:MAG: permease [Ardenticatenales bacterium]
MSVQAVSRSSERSLRRYLRPAIMLAGLALIFYIFWVTSRYPSLFSKAAHLKAGDDVASMAYGSAKFKLDAAMPVWQQIVFSALNWLDGMKVGMTFGVLFGAWLHTVLHYYPLKIGRNAYLNSITGAVIGAPIGVCANCSVPAACGLTRGRGRAELALGFLFSSPNFNPVVLAMTFTALPLRVSLAKYGMLLVIIAFVVPFTVRSVERNEGLTQNFDADDDQPLIGAVAGAGDAPVGKQVVDLMKRYVQGVWMLAKPTLTLMVLASFAAAALLILLPWQSILANAGPVRLALIGAISTFMPIPIALDVMFAAQLQRQGVDLSYVMLFALTLGTFSMVPFLYLWREISRRLAVTLAGFILLCGWLAALLLV